MLIAIQYRTLPLNDHFVKSLSVKGTHNSMLTTTKE